MNNNVSVEKIQAGIDYLESEFMAPLINVGETLIDDFKIFNQHLGSDVIDAAIEELREKLDNTCEELSNICKKAKGEMEDSSETIEQRQAEIESNLEDV